MNNLSLTLEQKKHYLNSQIESAWSGHLEFADWLVRYKNPSVIVELGVDYGFSLCSFALSNIGDVYGVDWFKGDMHTGYRYTRPIVERHINYLEFKNIHLIESTFDEAVNNWYLPIDILHIDGLHTYEAVRNDFEKWSKFVKAGGVILMHDTCIDWFGVKDFFHEIGLSKLNFINSCGLGVVSTDVVLLNDIKKNFDELLDKRYK